MKVTSDTLFHFSNSLKNIQNILEHKFKLTYCKEEIDLNGMKMGGYFPMVTFCDIPLSLSKEHVEKYGSYAIGLKKEWGIEHKLNPVIYLEKKSMISEDLGKSFNSLEAVLGLYSRLLAKQDDKNNERLSEINEIANNIDKKKFPLDIKKKISIFKEDVKLVAEEIDNYKELIGEVQKLLQSQISILRYCKNYQGDLIRNDKTIKNYRFYDEREWRFVPSKDFGISSNLTHEEYLVYRGDKSKPKPLIESLTLNFSASDIKYIIVKSEKDIPRLIRFISGTNNLTKNPDEAAILSTKILTVNQLNQDF